MNFADAAHQVLSDAGEALSGSEIARRAIAQGLITPKSDSPGTFVAAAMRRENRKRKQAGMPQRFVAVGSGLFTLS